jgi:CheY-like chemotaxis protein
VLTGDAVRLTQILNNLLSNAIKFTDKGFVQLQVNLEEDSGENCKVFFIVKDTGIGIGKEKLEKVFQAFEQAERSTTRMYGGTGLGLSITKKLIELQNGHIQVESTEGTGSQFYFSLPFKKGHDMAPRISNSSVVHKADLGHIRLLLVEDNQVNVMVARKFLQRWNIVPELAENGQEALQKLGLQKFDIILMDLQMPVMNGLEATGMIRSTEGINRHVPIIALTADVSADVEERVKAAGINHYLTKPFQEKDLYHALIAYTKPVTQQLDETVFKQNISENDQLQQIDYQQINRLAEGDKQFMNELLAACLDNISELQISYTQSMKSNDEESLRESIHKFRSILHLLQLANLQNLLERSKKVLQIGDPSGEDVCLLIMQTEEECQRVKDELCQYRVTYESHMQVNE